MDLVGLVHTIGALKLMMSSRILVSLFPVNEDYKMSDFVCSYLGEGHWQWLPTGRHYHHSRYTNTITNVDCLKICSYNFVDILVGPSGVFNLGLLYYHIWDFTALHFGELPINLWNYFAAVKKYFHQLYKYSII